jgi:hypothetical protein
MKISELKQPYRRMAEYLAKSDDKNNLLSTAFIWENTDDLVWRRLYYGIYSPITEEIKTHFPADFDFSGEEQPLQIPNNPIIQNRIYTQLAKEGRFNELPATCEFSEPVELEVWDDDGDYLDKLEISGKYKGFFVDDSSNGLYSAYQHAQLPTKKIDFTQFQTGDVVEVELIHNEKRIGWFDYVNDNHVVINILKRKSNQVFNGGNCSGSKMLNKENIKLITKIK